MLAKNLDLVLNNWRYLQYLNLTNRGRENFSKFPYYWTELLAYYVCHRVGVTFLCLFHVAIAQKLHLQLTRSVVCSNVRPTKPMGGGSRGRAVSGPCCFDQLNCWNLFFHCDKKLLLLKSFLWRQQRYRATNTEHSHTLRKGPQGPIF